MTTFTLRILIVAVGGLLAGCNSGPASSGSVGGAPGAASGWIESMPSGMAGATLADAAPFGTGYVVVGAAPDAGSAQAGGIWTSADGTTWNLVGANLATVHVKAVTAAGDELLVAGEHCTGECIGLVLLSSKDGKAWSDQIKASGTEDDVAIGVAVRGGSSFVALSGEIVDLGAGNAENGRAMTSSDGATWTIAPAIDSMSGVRLGGMASGTSAFVAVGSIESGSTRTGATWSSPDGKTWAPGHNDPSFAGALLTSVVAGGPGFVAAGSIGANGAVWTSTDGASWTHVDAPSFAGRPIVDIAAAHSGLVAVGNDASGGHAWLSTDGLAWHDVGAIPGSDNAKFVAVALGSGKVLIAGKPLPGSDPAGIVWLGPLPG